MIARIADNHWLYIDQVTAADNEFIDAHFSVRNPKAYYIDTESSWDGWYRFYYKKQQRLALPFLDELIICCKKLNIPLDIYDHRKDVIYPAPVKEDVTPDLLSGVTLENYQIRSILTTINSPIGCIQLPTGGGKSEVMCGIAKIWNVSTAIITEQIVVLDQIVERLQLRDVVKEEELGMFCHGSLPDSSNKVMVGSIQSILIPVKPKKTDVVLTHKQIMKKLYSMAVRKDVEEMSKCLPKALIDPLVEKPKAVKFVNGKYLQIVNNYLVGVEFERRINWYNTRCKNATIIRNLLSTCELLLVDEADLASTKQYNILFRKIFKGRRCYGFSGTFNDPDKKVNNMMIKQNLGNVLIEVPRSELQACGRIIPIKAIFVCVGLNGDRKDRRTYDIAMKEEIVENVDFHNLIKKLGTSFPDDGKLILIDTSPIGPLGYALEELIHESKFIWNESSRSERNECINKFTTREIKCLISGKILKRGTDLKGGTENLIIIGGGKHWSNINQLIGRAVRINSSGFARVFFFFHLNNKYLYDHSKRALKAVLGMGYQATVVVNGRQIDGNAFVKSQFRIPK